MKALLTDDSVATYMKKPPVGKRQELYRDTGCKGLALCVTSAGTASWLIDLRLPGGAMHQERFSNPDETPLQDARARADKRIKELRENPEAAKTAASATLRDSLELYWRKKKSPQTTIDSMTTTLTSYGWLDPLDPKNPDAKRRHLLDMSMNKITGKLAMDALEAAWLRSPTQGNMLMAYCRSIYNVEKVTPNPFAGIAKHKVKPGTPLAVPPDAWGPLLTAVNGMRSRISRLAILTGIYTGFRPLAICNMEWKHLTLTPGNASYFIGEGKEAVGFKEGRSWHYPIPEVLADEFRKWLALHGGQPPYGSKWIIHARVDPSKPATNFHESFHTVVEKIDLGELTPYNLRDTRGTYCERYFGDTVVTQRMLNHRPDYVKSGTNKSTRKYIAPLKTSAEIRAARDADKNVDTTSGEMRGLVERYAEILHELAGLRPMSAQVRAVFVEQQPVAMMDREEI